MTGKVVGSMSEWSGMLRDLFRQIDDGSITGEQLQVFLEHKDPFDLRDVSALLVDDWQRFYEKVFDISVDFSGFRIPAKKRGFDRLIVVAQGMTPQRLYDKCRELFPCWKWTDKNLDEIVQSDKTAKDGPYAVWFRDTIEADEDLKSLSANDLKRKGVPGITLEERLIYELKYFKETGNHLDIVNITLCTGSRDSDGEVPGVNWSPDGRELYVRWGPPGYFHPSLRSRRAVP